MLKSLSFNHNQGFPRLPTFKKRVYELNYSDQRTLRKQIVKQRYTETWRLSLRERSRDSITIAKIRAKTKHFKAQKKFSLDCLSDISGKSLIYISQYFKEFTALQSLQIDLSPAWKITNTALLHLSEGLKRFSSLENLDIRFSGSASRDESLDILRRGFRKHMTLKKISLTFVNCLEITDKGIKNLCKDLKNLVFLRSLTLDFYACICFTDEGLLSMKGLLKRLRSLQQVNLDFRYCQGISLSGAEQIIEGFEDTLGYPKNVNFSFFGSECSIGLSEKKEGLKSNIFFQVDFLLIHKTAQFSVFKKLLRRKTNLRDLDFVFQSFYDINNRVLKNIRQTVGNLASLETINVQFPMYNKIDDKLLKNIMQFFKSLLNVKQMKLEFFKENWITDKGLQQLGKDLKEHRSLGNLQISFEKCLQITDESLEKMSQSFRKMATLENIDLDFSGCRLIGDLGVRSVVESLKKCVVLQEVTLKFDRNSRITNVGRDQIIETLKRHRSLKMAKIDFGVGVGDGLQIIEIMRDRDDQVEDEEVEQNLAFLLWKGIINFFKKISISLFQCCYEVHTE